MTALPARALEQLLEGASQMAFLKRADGAYLFVNRQWCAATGLARERVIGKKDAEVFPKAVAARFRAQDRKVARLGRALEFVETIQLPDRTHQILTVKFPLRDEKGEVWAVGGASLDVEARTRSERMLAEAEQLAQIGSFEADVRRQKAWRSPGLHRIFGVDRFEPEPQAILRYVHPDDRERFGAFMHAVMKHGKAYSTDYRLVRPDGRERIIHVEGHAERDAAGKPTRVYGWIQDITERRLLEGRILDIADRERRSVGQDLHDDLGQRLTGVTLLARALARRLKSQAEREAAKKIVAEAEGALSAVRAIARGLQSVPADPEGLAEALRALASNARAAAGIDCVFRCPERVLLSDPAVANHLYRIAQEALHNALRHAQARGIELRLEKAGRGVSLSVRDDGRGIPERAQASGLGLNIMRHRASLIHAALTIGPAESGGTLVRCVVPC